MSNEVSPPSAFDEGLLENLAATLAEGKALSERMRARAALDRVINKTGADNDHDLEARTVDALLELVETNHLQDVHSAQLG